METYKQEFQAAFDRTIRLGFSHPPLQLVENRLLLPQNKQVFLSAINSYGFSKIDEIAFRCIAISMKILPDIKEIFGNAYLSIGYVTKRPTETTPGYLRYGEFNEHDLESWTKQSKPFENKEMKFPGHIWITLPSLEIIDITLYTSRGSVTIRAKPAIGLIKVNYPITLIEDKI